MMNCCILATLLALAFSLCVGAQPIKPISDIDEGFKLATELSGGLVAGVMCGNTKFPVKDAAIFLSAKGAPASGELFVMVQTTDGLYTGVATYRLPAKTGVGTIALSFPSRESVRLATYASGEVLCLVECIDPEEPHRRLFLPAAWTEAVKEPVVIMLNSGSRADGGSLRVMALDEQNEPRDLPTSKIKKGLVYDSEVSLQGADLAQLNVLTVQRRVFGRPKNATTFAVPSP